MANPQQAVTSLLTEHFRYTPLTLLDDVINTVNELIYRAVTAVEEGLTSTPPESLGFSDTVGTDPQSRHTSGDGSQTQSTSRAEIENGVHQLETLLQATVDKNFDKLEIFVLRNILSVPEDLAPWMQLAHYKDLDLSHQLQSDTSQPQPTAETLHRLRRKLTETRKLNAALLAERARNEAYIAQLRSLLIPTDPSKPSLSFITSTPAARELGISFTANGKAPLTNLTQAAVSHLPALKQLLASLKPKGEEGGLQYARRNPAADERREYIEMQVRRRFEKDGADLGTGEGLQSQGRTAGGRRVGVEEVRSIERVVEMLQKDSRDDGGGGTNEIEE